MQHFILDSKDGVIAMKRKYKRIGFTAAQKAELWDRWLKGEGLQSIDFLHFDTDSAIFRHSSDKENLAQSGVIDPLECLNCGSRYASLHSLTMPTLWNAKEKGTREGTAPVSAWNVVEAAVEYRHTGTNDCK